MERSGILASERSLKGLGRMMKLQIGEVPLLGLSEPPVESFVVNGCGSVGHQAASS